MAQLSEQNKGSSSRWLGLSRHGKKSRMDVDWSKLHQELLVQIAEDHLSTFEDFTMFSCVSCSWAHAAAACNLFKLRCQWSRHQMPWLMLTDSIKEMVSVNDVAVEYHAPGESDKHGADDNNVENCTEKAKSGHDEPFIKRKAWDIRRSKFYNIYCPQGYGKVCWGSPHGWIVMMGLDYKMYMFSPISKSRYSLPSQRGLPFLSKRRDAVTCKHLINKVVVLKVPKGAFTVGGCISDEEETLLVVAMYGYSVDVEGQGHIAIAYPEDFGWTGLEWLPVNGRQT